VSRFSNVPFYTSPVLVEQHFNDVPLANNDNRSHFNKPPHLFTAVSDQLKSRKKVERVKFQKHLYWGNLYNNICIYVHKTRQLNEKNCSFWICRVFVFVTSVLSLTAVGVHASRQANGEITKLLHWPKACTTWLVQ